VRKLILRQLVLLAPNVQLFLRRVQAPVGDIGPGQQLNGGQLRAGAGDVPLVGRDPNRLRVDAGPGPAQ